MTPIYAEIFIITNFKTSDAQVTYYLDGNLGLLTKYSDAILIYKYGVLMIPVLLVTGAMYVRVILVLKNGAKHNERKRNLSIAFSILWLSWAIFMAPFAIYEVYEHFFAEFFNDVQVNTFTGADFLLTTYYGPFAGEWMTSSKKLKIFSTFCQNHFNMLQRIASIRTCFLF